MKDKILSYLVCMQQLLSYNHPCDITYVLSQMTVTPSCIPFNLEMQCELFVVSYFKEFSFSHLQNCISFCSPSYETAIVIVIFHLNKSQVTDNTTVF